MEVVVRSRPRGAACRVHSANWAGKVDSSFPRKETTDNASRAAGISLLMHRLLSMLAKLRFSGIQIGLVLFWAIWLTVVTATNVFDAMKQLGALPAGFTLASYNFELVEKTVGAHGVPTIIAALLFAGVIVWELLASALLWRAWLAMHRGAPGTAAEVMQAFAVSLALWAAFLIATEVTVNYATTATHKATLIAQLASLIVIRAHHREEEPGQGEYPTANRQTG